MAKSPCGETDHTPKRPDNRAGLREINYRITRQPEALARMLWSLPRKSVTDPTTGARLNPLSALRTRDLSDPTISLIDAYAMACDVVSFYSERVANEGYIGTATQRRSVLELARMIGYELAPGVAASTYLAFTVEDLDDPFRRVEVDTGTQAMSIPHEKGKMPQIFETVEPITARAEWNAIHARTTRPQNLVLFDMPDDPDHENNGTLYLFDLDGSFDTATLNDPDLVTFTSTTQLKPYHPMDRRLDLHAALTNRIADSDTNTDIKPEIYALPINEVCLTGLGLNLRPGARMLAVGQSRDEDAEVHAIPLRVVEANEDRSFKITKVVLTRSGQAPEKVRRSPPFLLAKLVFGILPARREPLTTQTVERNVRGRSWSGDGLSALVQSQGWQRDKLMTLVKLLVEPEPEEEMHTELGLHVMDDSAGIFGSTATRWDILDFGSSDNGKDKGPYTHNWDGAFGASPNTAWVDALNQNHADRTENRVQLYLDREIKTLSAGGWAIVENEKGGTVGLRVTHSAVEARADYGTTGKATALGLRTASDDDLELGKVGSENIYNSFLFRGTLVHVASRYLPLSGVPLDAELPLGVSSLELDRLYLDLERGRPVSLSGARCDAEGILGRETHLIKEVQHIDGVTRLLFSSETAHPYERTSVRINANVALATHGETVTEDLGSGDATQGFQIFTLKKPPLTHVSAANASGRASTLEVRVDGILWDETPALGEAGPEDAVYEIRQSDDGNTHVRFGDGKTGRSLPTGTLNVTSQYRSGIGADGEVPEEAISQLKTKPLGIRSVVNPSPALGAAAPETLESARVNAPGSVKSLGRIVSLTDYEVFAQSFAGIGKAQARELWSGQNKVVHLTVAPENDSELSPSDPLMVNLTAAVEAVRDPARPLILQPLDRLFFAMTARITPDPAYRAEDVILAARTEIEARFGYEARALAQTVSAAEIIAALHAAAGVVSVDLDALSVLLDGSGETEAVSLASVLTALPARGPGQRSALTEFSAAQLLTVLPSAIALTVTEVVDA